MKLRKNGTWVLWYESFGFGLILLLIWLNQLTDLPDLILVGQPYVHNVRYSLVETVVILAIWGIVFLLTNRLVAHLHYLEGLLRVCAWCRKVSYNGNWVRLEQYFASGFNVDSTHGMCPDCLKRVEEETKRFYRAEVEQREGPHPAASTQTGTSNAAISPMPAPVVSTDPASNAEPTCAREAA